MRHALISIPVILTLAACSEPRTSVEIPFVATWGDQAMSCDDGAAGITLNDMRFYVSRVELIDDSGAAVELELQPDQAWQSTSVAMIDLENGQGACLNGTQAMNDSMTGSAPAGDYRGVRFVVGVPFGLNHANPLTAEAPLDDAAMHWHWRSGYKFLRAGVDHADDGFWIHLGSAGCEGTVQNISSCRFPNRVTVQIDDFEPGRDSVVIDLQALTGGTDLLDGAATDCISSPAEESCVAPFRALGLDHASGAAGNAQSVFLSKAP